MLRYKKMICLKQNENNDVVIETDQAAVWFCNEHTGSIFNWWQKQHQSELRQWQKDVAIKMAADALGKYSCYLIYKKTGEYNQQHDMALAYFHKADCYVFSTLNDFWIQPRDKSNCTKLLLNDSLGSVMDSHTRLNVIYPIFDELACAFAKKDTVF